MATSTVPTLQGAARRSCYDSYEIQTQIDLQITSSITVLQLPPRINNPSRQREHMEMTVVHDLPLLCTSTLGWLCILDKCRGAGTKSAPATALPNSIKPLSKVAVHRRRNSSVSSESPIPFNWGIQLEQLSEFPYYLSAFLNSGFWALWV